MMLASAQLKHTVSKPSTNDGTKELTRRDYLDTTIILNEADATFGNTLGLNEATSSGLGTSDGGKTWAVGTISHKAHTFAVTK